MFWQKARIIGTFSILPAIAVAANPHGEQRSSALQKLVDCRQVAEPTQRLACYDEQVKAFDLATARKDVVVLDRAQIAETKRGLFGFALPHIALFDTHDDDADSQDKAKHRERPAPEETRLETTIKALHRNANGLWVITLEDDAVWEEVEAGREANSPKPGMKIVIKRATMGTYFATMPGSIYMRIRRID